MECVCVIEVDDPVTTLREVPTKAAKAHKCMECGCNIKSGEKYIRETYVQEGVFGDHKYCWMCHDIAETYFRSGFLYGEIVCEFEECFGWNYVTGEIHRCEGCDHLNEESEWCSKKSAHMTVWEDPCEHWQ